MSGLNHVTAPMRIAVAGASGRMGHMLLEAVNASEDCVLSGALDIASSPAINSDALGYLGQASGVFVTNDFQKAFRNPKSYWISHDPKAHWHIYRHAEN